MTPAFLVAHGIGGVQDLPVPLWLFYYGAAIVLVVSFVALGVLWKRPLLEQRANGRPLGPRLQRILQGPELRGILGAISLGLLALVFLTAWRGDRSPAANLAPTFIYVVFWLGLVPLIVIFGNFWRALSPWRVGADAVAVVARAAGYRRAPPLRYPEWLGRVPGGILLMSFAAIELAYPDSANPRALALAVAIYSAITWGGMLLFGRSTWADNGEGFNVYFELLSRVGAVGYVDRKIVLRPPVSGLARRDDHPGTVFFVSVMLGSVAFDGFSRTTWWQDRALAIEARWALDNPALSDTAVMLLNLLGLFAVIGLVALLFLAAVEAARTLGGTQRSLAPDFVGSLVPIALAYAVAHYFSLLMIQGQYAIKLASDPFGYGWDLFGTADNQPTLTLLSPNTIWYVQVGALVIGHVLGLVLAHDRAISLFGSARTALRTQYAMLVLMVAYTVGGLYLLSAG